MAIKVENIAVNKGYSRNKDFGVFVETLRDLKVGESFVHNFQSHHRLAVTIMQHLFHRQYTTRKEPGNARGHRIGRIA
jgi:hypothetical protein